MVQLTKITDEK